MTTIVSLSAIPSRFDALYPVLENLLLQDVGIDELRLYIPKKFRRFPEYAGELPDVPKGVRIMQPEDDLGPASKILFAADDLKGEDCDIIFCDDDMLFEPSRFSRMVAARDGRMDHCVSAEPGFIMRKKERLPAVRQPSAFRAPKPLSYRAKRVAQFYREMRTGVKEVKAFHPSVTQAGYANILQGFGGVLVRPEYFDELFYDIPDILWTVDDYWISGHFERKGIPIWGPANFERPLDSSGKSITALQDSIIDGANRDEANNACVRYFRETYGIWQF